MNYSSSDGQQTFFWEIWQLHDGNLCGNRKPAPTHPFFYIHFSKIPPIFFQVKSIVPLSTFLPFPLISFQHFPQSASFHFSHFYPPLPFPSRCHAPHHLPSVTLHALPSVSLPSFPPCQLPSTSSKLPLSPRRSCSPILPLHASRVATFTVIGLKSHTNLVQTFTPLTCPSLPFDPLVPRLQPVENHVTLNAFARHAICWRIIYLSSGSAYTNCFPVR